MISGPRRFSRRQVLTGAMAVGAGALLLACGDDGASPPASSPISAAGGASPASEAAPPSATTVDDTQIGPQEDAPPTLETEPLIWVTPKEVSQGSVFLVAVDAPGAGFASVAFGGQVISLLREGSRFFTILGIDALTPVGPVPVVIAIADAGGRPVVQQETLVTVRSSNWQTEVVELDESNRALLDPEIRNEDSSTRGPVLRRETPERHWDGVFRPPSDGVITSNYGLLRSYNFMPVEEYHEGLDFAGDNGDPVLSPNAGVVAWVGQTRRRGNGLIIDHGGGVFSGYYHLSEVVVAVGDVVNSGEFIARIGATGLATGPHLHWEVVVHGITVDPVQWFRENEFPNPVAELDPAEAVQGPNQRAG
ncbi:MAG: M23 family metallopeptidase [Dehalococcoidia bacterium]